MATSTPWGPSQGSNKIATGIMFYHTARHGGVHLSPKRNAQVPEYMRAADGWYEEDCEWSLAAAVFFDEFLADAQNHKDISKDEYYNIVLYTMRDWYPEHYETFMGVVLTEGVSFKRDEAIFKSYTKNDYVVTSAIGRDNGMVECWATLGGRRDASTGRFFLVPQAEYNERGKHGFVIDTDKHADISAF